MKSHESEVIAIVQKVLARKGWCGQIAVESLLREDLALDSMDIAEVLLLLEELRGQELDPLSVFPLRTVKSLCDLQPRLHGTAS